MRALLWLKTLREKVLLKENIWWENLSSCRMSTSGFHFEIPWQLPICSSMKFNVDEVTSGNVTGCAGILRNYVGNLKAIFSGPVMGVGADFAELSAVKTTLEVFVETEWDKEVDLFVDSNLKVVLFWIKNNLFRHWH
ncbi:hypothetical protein GQ457_13G000990 [Hibiscus cannabinus]